MRRIAHQGVYFQKVVCDHIMTFTAGVMTSTCAAPVYMVLLNNFFNLYNVLFCSVISCVYEQVVELNASKICKKYVH